MALAAAERAASPANNGPGFGSVRMWLMSRATNPQAVDIPRHALWKVTNVHQLRKWAPWSVEIQARPVVEAADE